MFERRGVQIHRALRIKARAVGCKDTPMPSIFRGFLGVVDHEHASRFLTRFQLQTQLPDRVLNGMSPGSTVSGILNGGGALSVMLYWPVRPVRSRTGRSTCRVFVNGSSLQLVY